jgi:protein SCO1/2
MRLAVSRHPLLCKLAGLALAALCAAAPARAGFIDGTGPGGSRTDYVPDSLKSVTVAEHPGATLPLDATFADEAGKSVTLREYFAGSRKPVLLQLGYIECPMLCGLVSRGLVDSLKDVKLNAGPDYDVLFVSIDPKEKPALAAQKKAAFLKEYGRDGATDGWHFLTGSKDQIDRLAQSVGYEYKWVELAQQYSHPAVVVLATPDGHVSRYLYGVKFDPSTVRLSLVEASGNKIGSTADQFILTCFQYDGQQGRYAWRAIYFMKAGGLLTILAVGFVVFRFARAGNRRFD